MKQILIVFIFGLLIFHGCNKINYYPDKPLVPVKTRILAHAGDGGSMGIYQQNTYRACHNGFPKASGIEVDLQLSKDRTVWLSHDAPLPECGNIPVSCFAETRDADIIKLDTCLGSSYNFTKLEDIFHLMADSFPDKYIALDCKEWIPCAASSFNVLDVLNVIADEVNRLIEKYHLRGHVLIESEYATFLNYVKKYCTGAETYLSAYGDFERAMQIALEAGYSGISFKFNFEEYISEGDIQLLHRKGLKIQLWTINNDISLQQALAINPDYIQADNVNSDLVKKYYGKE